VYKGCASTAVETLRPRFYIAHHCTALPGSDPAWPPCTGSYEFERAEKEAAFLPSITKDQLLQFFDWCGVIMLVLVFETLITSLGVRPLYALSHLSAPSHVQPWSILEEHLMAVDPIRGLES
jgi:hypothetical protein